MLALGMVSQGFASTYYVDAARPDDLGDGLSWDNAKKTIQAAVTSSAAGDTILVKYGSYPITSDILIDSTRLLTSDDGSHGSWDSADPDSSLCIILPSVANRVFTVTGTSVTSATRLRGFKIMNGQAGSETTAPMYGGGIYIAGGADPVIEGCWVTNNRGSTTSNGYGGGIACCDAGTGAVIRYCRIDGNIAATAGTSGLGGGIYLSAAGPCQIYGNEIEHNSGSTARIGRGGGIYVASTTLQAWSNLISYNVGTSAGSAGGTGGGIQTYGGVVEIWDNVITYNHAAEGSGQTGHGGGIFHGGGGPGNSIIIRDNPAISYNTAATQGKGYGGGVAVEASYFQMYGNTIEGNIATSSTYATADGRTGYGGGVSLTSGNNVVRSNVILSNTASLHGNGYGGGLYYNYAETVERNVVAFNVASASATVTDVGYGGGSWFAGGWGIPGPTNNTFYQNANVIYAGVGGSGSGLYYSGYDQPAFVNNIIAGHDVANSDSIGFYSNSVYPISYNCFHGNTGGNYNANVTSTNEELGDPMLVDPAGGDFSLMYNSSCIEEGDPTFAVPGNGGWVIDIGAIEYTGTRHWRPVTGTGLLLFGGRVKAKVNVTALGTLSEIDMVVHPGETYPTVPSSVARWYDIDHVGEGMGFDLTLSYLESELNGQDENTLCMWRWSGSSWDGPKNYSSRNLTQNWITVAGQTAFSDWILTDDGGMTGIDESPSRFYLAANHPNPFNPSTTILYEIARPSHVRLDVFNAAGQLVRVLVDAQKSEGRYRAEWDGLDTRGTQAASGVYFYRLRAGDFEQSRKMVLVR